MRHISLQVTQSGIKSPQFDRPNSGEAEAIRLELNAHNNLQRARYRARQLGPARLTVVGAE